MHLVRQTLARLGWPVDFLDDVTIARHLGEIWCASDLNPDRDFAFSQATARGIVLAFAAAGNLDALCWPIELGDGTATPTEATDDADPGDEMNCAEVIEPADWGWPELLDTPPENEIERRRYPRAEDRQLVHFELPAEERSAGAFLIEMSASGMAMVVESADAPRVGQWLQIMLVELGGNMTEVGSAHVVRIDFLDERTQMVCVEFARTLELKSLTGR